MALHGNSFSLLGFVRNVMQKQHKRTLKEEIEMKRQKTMCLVLMVVVMCVLIFTAFASAEKLLYEQTFDTGDNNTIVRALLGRYQDYFLEESPGGLDKPMWSFEDGTLVFKRHNMVAFGTMWLGDDDWENYRVELRFRVDEYGDYGTIQLGWYADSKNSYRLVMYGPRYYIDKHENGGVTAIHGVPEGQVEFPVGQFRVVSVEVTGTTFKIYLDGQHIDTVEDPNATKTNGGVVVQGANAGITLDYIRVYGLD